MAKPSQRLPKAPEPLTPDELLQTIVTGLNDGVEADSFLIVFSDKRGSGFKVRRNGDAMKLLGLIQLAKLQLESSFTLKSV